jgi:hypothetical protein
MWHVASDFVRERDVHAPQPLERARLRGDVGDLAGRPAALRFVDELITVEPVEKGSEDFLGRELGANQTLKALVRA